MADVVKVELSGFKEMAEAMRAMDADVRTKLGYRAVARVMRATREDAIRIAHSNGLLRTGALIRNIALARINTGNSLVFAYDIGVRHGTRKQGKQTKGAGVNFNDPWYWFLHEFGFTNRAGGQVGPTPFITPAFQMRHNDGLEMMADTLRKGIAKHNKAKAAK
jgi:hypothetical protein